MGTSVCENEAVPAAHSGGDRQWVQYRTPGPAWEREKRVALSLAVVLAAAAAGADEPPAWPAFLPPQHAFPPEVAAQVLRVQADTTLRRTVRGRPVRVPLPVYAAFVDAPEVTAAAARALQIANYEVRPLGPDWYAADDHDGARGEYRVLLREGGRRVILSWGEHSSIFLGTIRGSALTVLDLAPQDAGVDQALTAFVRIDHRVAAALARILVVLFGSVADRKLMEGFEVAAQVAEWGTERPREFCAWLAGQPLPAERREPLLRHFPACH